MDSIRIFEVGPRDGLQNETRAIPSEIKVKLINLLSESGIKNIEAASFVSPKWVPQMADSDQVMANISRKHDISYAALTPNMKGYESARRAQVDQIAIFASASEAFSQKNINCSITESLERFEPVILAAQADGIPVRGYVSCIVNCPYGDSIYPKDVALLTRNLIDMGCYEVSLGDTTGAATPDQITSLLDVVLNAVPASDLSGHYHDTEGFALLNIEASIEAGLRSFDTSVGGLGGCPYAPGAKGNVDTGLVVRRLHSLGWGTGINIEALAKAEQFVEEIKSMVRCCDE